MSRAACVRAGPPSLSVLVISPTFSVPLVSGTCVFVIPVYEWSHLCGKPDGLHLRLHQQLDRTLLHWRWQWSVTFSHVSSHLRSLSVRFNHTLCVRGSSSTGICDVREKVGLVWDKSNLRSYLCSKRELSPHINRMHTCVYNKIYTSLLLAFLCIVWGDDFSFLYSSFKKPKTPTFTVSMS